MMILELRRKSRLLLLFFAILFSNKNVAQTYVKFIDNSIEHTKILDEKEATLGIFKVKETGYQGYSENDIQNLPEFIVKPGKNVTSKIQRIINKASNTITNGKMGARVIFEPGLYVVNGIHIKSNVHIRLKPNVIIEPDQSNPKKVKKTKLVFGVGRNGAIENVSVVGLGKGTERAIIRYVRESNLPKTGGARAFSIRRVTNLFIQNILIEDDQTRFSGVAFSSQKGMKIDSSRAKNVTVDFVKQTNAAFGYGLIQSNSGKNLLFSNLHCTGGVTARLETDNRYSQSPFGVDNVFVKNVTNVKGKAAVYLNPHTVINGNIFVDGAHAIRSQMAIEIRPGYKDPTGKGRYGKDSFIENVSAVYGLDATVQYSAKKFIPQCLLSYFKKNTQPDAESKKGIKIGPSVCVIGDFTGQIKIDESTISASIPSEETNPDNSLESRKSIVRTKAYRGKDKKRSCGNEAYK